jgi:type VI secretion system protein ImpD
MKGAGLPDDGGGLGASDLARQPESEASGAGAAVTPGLRKRFLTEVLALAKEGTGHQPVSLLEAADVAGALEEWFGPELPGFVRDKASLLAALDRDIAAIDALLSDQINAILHAPAFQRLEAAWRGLRYMTDVAYGIADAKIRFLSLSWNELVRDLERAADFDQSQLFHKIYSEEFGMPGGEPFGLLIADYAMQHFRTADHPTDDVSALKSLSAVAAAAFAPIVLGVSPSVFQLDSFRELGRPLDLRAVFRSTEYQRWNSMREGSDMNFIGLALPRILMRLPYTDDSRRVDGFRFCETVHEASGAGYLWGNAGFAFAGIVLRAFGNFGWFADIRGAPRDELRGGLVADIPVPWFHTDRPKIAVKPSTECCISDMHEKDLAELGFIALRKIPLTEFSVFNECQSVQIPARYDRATATANARLSVMLQYTLCISRFAHFIKVIGRERVGSVITAEECQDLLQRWLTGYCVGNDSATAEMKARYPLREGNVEVKNVPGRPGFYACNIFLRPHFQLDDIAAGFRLITELAPPSRA